MKSNQLRLLEFAPNRTMFNQILNDDTILMGFECELITDIEEPERQNDVPDYNYMSFDNLRHLDEVDMSSRQEERIAEKFYEWLSDKGSEILVSMWAQEKRNYTRQWCLDNGYLTNDDADEDSDEEPEEQDEEAIIDQYENDAESAFYDENREGAEDGFSINDFIEATWGTNTNMMQAMGIYYNTGEYDDDEVDNENAYYEMAHSLREVVDGEVELHNDSDPDVWHIIEDASLVGNGNVTAEVVSSVYQLREGIEMLNKVFNWMDEQGYSTNSSTGMHVSFSIEGKNANDYDFLKMIILFDENYTADIFKRMENGFAKQMRKILFTELPNVASLSTLTDRQLNQTIDKLRQITRSLSLGNTKYRTFRHRANGVVEFRSMGGKDYETKFDLIRKRIVNMAYLMKVGSDPTLMAREYVTRIFKMLTVGKFADPTLGSGAKRIAQLPLILSSFTPIFTHPDSIAKANNDPMEFLWEVADRVQSLKLTLIQIRQLRFYVAKTKLTAVTVRAAFLKDSENDKNYNAIAAIMRWPLVVPGQHPVAQATLPFAQHGDDPGEEDMITLGSLRRERDLWGRQHTLPDDVRTRTWGMHD